MKVRIRGGRPLKGEVQVAADKSLTHRALMLGAVSDGRCVVTARQPGADNFSTAEVLRQLGVQIDATDTGWVVHGVGRRGLRAPADGRPLDCGNSGTTIRLLTGLLAGAGVQATLTGDASLSVRPMGRVCEPLRALGADVCGQNQQRQTAGTEGKPARELPPVVIGCDAAAGHGVGGGFVGGAQTLNVASAQVKSALLLAGVMAGKSVAVTEPSLSRDHTERMLRAMGANIETSRVAPHTHAMLARFVPGSTDGAGRDTDSLSARNVTVPADISSAAFWLAAGALVPGSDIQMPGVGVNPTRTGIVDVLQQLGAGLEQLGAREEAGEPVATLRVRYCDKLDVTAGAANGSSAAANGLELKGDGSALWVGGPLIPRLIDELVVLAAVFARSQGTTVVHQAAELRVKESDRVAETVRLLRAFGADIEPAEDGYRVNGPVQLRGAHVNVGADHRLALAAAVIAAAAEGESVLEGFEIANVSYPGFLDTLVALGGDVTW